MENIPPAARGCTASPGPIILFIVVIIIIVLILGALFGCSDVSTSTGIPGQVCLHNRIGNFGSDAGVSAVFTSTGIPGQVRLYSR